jgi:hypothetical protein
LISDVCSETTAESRSFFKTKNMRTIKFVLLLLALATIHSRVGAQETVVPKSACKPVLIDGKIASDEWQDAMSFAVDTSTTLMLKSTDEYLFVAILAPPGKTVIVDIYILNNGHILNLHASAKLGQRVFNGTWQEWSWWNNAQWVANTSRPTRFDKPEFLEESAREFQIKKLLLDKGTPVMVEVISLSEGKVINTVTYPAAANPVLKETWKQLKF